MDRHPPAARAGRGIPRRPLMALALAGLFVFALGPMAMAAQPEVPGNNGTVKIHEGAGEPASERRNEPHVFCTFHLHFFFADAGDSGTWEIQKWSPGSKGDVVLNGTYLTDENGEDRDPDAGTYSLPDGHYKLFWDGDLDTRKHDKHKVFWIDCEDQGGVSETPPAPPPPGGKGTTPPGGEVTPPPAGGVGPAEGTPPPTTPEGQVAGATGVPRTTLPPTDTVGQATANPAGPWATLLILFTLIATVTLATVPVSALTRGRRR